MRLTPDQVNIIRTAVAQVAGADAQVWLFGSRVHDEMRGGDVDLLLESSPAVEFLERALIKTRLENQLNLPVDIVVADSNGPPSPFVRIARRHAVALSA